MAFQALLVLSVLITVYSSVPAVFAQIPNSDISEAEKTLQGTVRDAETGDPVPYANVYLSGTSTGTTTDENGSFALPTDLTGNHQIVFSYLGYITQAATVNLSSQSSFTFNIRLQVDPYELEELEVTGSRDREWERQYEEFQRQFLGTTEFAEMTGIENPWYIDFSVNDDRNIVASATQPLEINNNALGYKIYADLITYEWDPRGFSGRYYALTRFEELESDSESEKLEWLENRQNAYLGSIRHFLQSLYQNQTEPEGFRITRANEYSPVIEISPVSNAELRDHLLRSGLSPSRYQNIYKGFDLSPFDGEISVYYTDERNRRHHSRLTVCGNDDRFYITEEGELLTPNSLCPYLEWTEHRMANFLPFDYRPPVEN